MRTNIEAADQLIGKRFPVLDKGFVELREYMGGDAAMANAARTSYQKGTKTSNDDAGLLDHLIRNHHSSPTEMTEIVVHMKMPIFVARQLVRHRTASLNEMSGRYSILPDEAYLPAEDRIRVQSQENKQGTGTALPKRAPSLLRSIMEEQQRVLFEDYHDFLADDVARELARINLPLSTYTEMVWKIDLNNLFKTLKLRLDEHAQYEIRVYFEVLLEIARAVAPMATASFENHILGAVSFSRDEWEALKEFLEDAVIEMGRSPVQMFLPNDQKARERFVKKLLDGKQR